MLTTCPNGNKIHTEQSGWGVIFLKKVIAVNSSRRRQNTYHLIQSAEELLQKNNIELKIINLYDYDIRDCSGCECCIRKSVCPVQDDVSAVMQEIIAADGVILTSPVYVAGVSGKLKTFIDRTCSWYHRPPLVAKPVVLMTTTAGGYAKDVLNYMEKVSDFWGMRQTGKIYRTVGNIRQGVTEKELSSFIRAIKSPKSSYKPALKALISYQVQKVLALKIMPIDKEFWEQKHWDARAYYYPCSISLPKRLIAGAFYKLLDVVIKPAK